MTIPPEKEFNLKKSHKNIFLNIWKLTVRLITTYYHHYHCLLIQPVLLKLLLIMLYSCKSRGSHLTYRKYLSYNPFTSSVLCSLHSHWMSLALISLLSRWRVWTSEWLNNTRKIVQSETATSEIWISFLSNWIQRQYTQVFITMISNCSFHPNTQTHLEQNDPKKSSVFCSLLNPIHLFYLFSDLLSLFFIPPSSSSDALNLVFLE